MAEARGKDARIADELIAAVCRALGASIVRTADLRAPVLAALAAARREGAEEERRACVAVVEEYAQRARHDWPAEADAEEGLTNVLEALRNRGEAPGILGCMPDLTGGRTTLEYLETIRDGEDDG